jgi:hypothetical protein
MEMSYKEKHSRQRGNIMNVLLNATPRLISLGKSVN